MPDELLSCSRYATLVRQCGSLEQGKLLHARIAGLGLDVGTYLGNLLVQMYGRCKSPDAARSAFDAIRARNAYSWSIMVAAYAQNGHLEMAAEMFEQMPEKTVVAGNTLISAFSRHGYSQHAMRTFLLMDLEGIPLSSISFLSVLKACGEMGLPAGKAMLSAAVDEGLIADVAVGTAMLSMFGKCGSIAYAELVFRMMQQRNLRTWTALLGAYALNGYFGEAIFFFRYSLLQGLKPDAVMLLSLLDACGSLQSKVEACFAESVVLCSDCATDLRVQNALLNMFGKCRLLDKLEAFFEAMPIRNTISWTCMIAAYAQNGHNSKALHLFRLMDLEGVVVDEITFVSVADACDKPETAACIRNCLPEFSNLETGTALINMCVKFGDAASAKELFQQMPAGNAASWNALMAMYSVPVALDILRLMDLEGVVPNRITLMTLLDACANAAALQEAKIIHESIKGTVLGTDLRIGNALVNAYGKCGCVEEARATFDELNGRDVVSWTSMVEAYAQNGCGEEAVNLFREMELEGLEPNRITFVSIISGCAHSGLLDHGLLFFLSQLEDHGLPAAAKEDYCGIIDLLGRSGHLEEAKRVIQAMPFEPHPLTWKTLLGACRVQGDVGAASIAARKAADIEPQEPSVYVLLSNACSLER